MIDSTDELRAILEGTPLAGREVVAIEVPASRGGGGPTTPVDPPVVLAVRIEPHELMAAWTVARELLDRTGRWPVANCSFDFELDDSSELGAIVDNLDRVEYAFELAGDTDPASIIERSRQVDVDAVFDRLSGAADWLEVPDPAGVPDSVPVFNPWFEPTGQMVALLFLPEAEPEHALAYVHWFAGNPSLPSHELIAVLRRWREELGAELVAHWGTMLQLVVGRPPTTIEGALALARQQELIAPCTTAMPGASTEELAASLRSAGTWFLHERP